jgi:formiminotetrahydrofolate cyclodeaminase
MTEKENRKASLAEMTVSAFLEKIASAAPVPGGGSVAALAAALAASLTEMVANLTIGKKGYETREAAMRDLADQAKSYRGKLTEAIDRDSDAYQSVLAAYKRPKNTDRDKELRRQAIQAALKTAAAVPLSVGKDAVRILEKAAKAVEEGNRNAVTDGAVGAMMARTAGLAALYNVSINLLSINDEAFVSEMSVQVQELARTIIQKESDILSTLGHQLGGGG